MTKWDILQIDVSTFKDLIPLRKALWPHISEDEHQKEVVRFLGRKDIFFFLARDKDAGACGFAEVSLKDHANGCDFSPVLFLEGIWVAKKFRRLGLGRELVKEIEQFAIDKNIPGLGSDCLIDNQASQKAHTNWGFEEVERVVCYAKKLLPKQNSFRCK